MKPVDSRPWIVSRFLAGTASRFAIAQALICQFAAPTLAQIIPDTTLPTPSDVPAGCSICTINGGTIRETNLFHSFSEFSVPTGGAAVFNNPLDIETIFSRVTGGVLSDIDGLIQANGTASLFLLNPNGILLGPNAQLDIGGSFLATTANAFRFEDQSIYSASSPKTSALLSISMPVGLDYWTSSPGTITSTSTIAVPPSRSLILAGGEILLDGGRLSAVGGRVELGGLATIGSLGLAINNEQIRLNFPEQVSRSDVSMVNNARVDVTADNRGDIVIYGQDVSLVGDRTRLLAGIDFFSGTSESQAGDIIIDATGIVTLDQADVLNEVLREATGQGGNITIIGREIYLIDGGQANSTLFGVGSTGKVILDAQEQIVMTGVGIDRRGLPLPSGVNSVITRGGIGKSAGIDILVGEGSLQMLDGATSAATVVGNGIAGEINIQVRDSVILDGVNELGFPSSFGSTIQTGASGQGGSIIVAAKDVAVLNGAEILASTRGFGDAGKIRIEASDTIALDGPDTFVSDFPGDGERVGGIFADVRSGTQFSPNAPPAEGDGGDIELISNSLSIADGAIIEASTSSVGDAGRISIQANDVLIQGRSVSRESPSGIFSTVQAEGVGAAGTIDVKTASLTIADGGAISAAVLGQGIAVNNEGTGQGGEITLTADALLLRNNGLISAETSSNDGGNITLQLGKLLLLRDSSLISTNAGIEQGAGNGGNIIVNLPEGFVVAIPEENSDITANAFAGNGGNVVITAQNILGIEPREMLTPLSDITASSEFGISGTIELNNLSVEPEQGLATLPVTLVDPSQLIAQGCDPTAVAAQGEFYTSGRGGVVPLGSDVLSSSAVLDDLRLPASWEENAPLIEAENWFVSDTGEVVLAADLNTTQQRCWHRQG